MNTKEQVMSILAEIKPNKDLSDVSDIVEGGYLDSFELMALIAQFTEVFRIEVEIDDISPENFNSIQAMAALVERLRSKS